MEITTYSGDCVYVRTKNGVLFEVSDYGGKLGICSLPYMRGRPSELRLETSGFHPIAVGLKPVRLFVSPEARR